MISDQKKIRKLAHKLRPVVYIGHQGITRSVISKTEEGLSSHELVKVKFNDHKNERQSLAEYLSRMTQSRLVNIIGHVAILYRENPDSKNRKI